MTSAGGAADRDACGDSELVDALVGGDLAALGTLYDRHASLAYGLALRMTGNPDRAEDVVQAAFMSLWSDRAAEHGGTDPVRLRLARLVARAATSNLGGQRPRPSERAIEPPAALLATQPIAPLPQGN